MRFKHISRKKDGNQKNWSIQPYPVTSKSNEYAKILKRKNDADFPKVNRWYRALQAAQVVKDCMVALDAGSKKVIKTMHLMHKLKENGGTV